MPKNIRPGRVHLSKDGSRAYCKTPSPNISLTLKVSETTCSTCKLALNAEQRRKRDKSRAQAAVLMEIPAHQPSALQMQLVLAWCRGDDAALIAHAFQMDRSTVYAHIQRLRDLGYTIPARKDCANRILDGEILPVSPIPDDNPQIDDRRYLQCAANNIDVRCHRNAHYFRDGFLVCRQHAGNRKFRPHETAKRIEGERPTPRKQFVACDDYWKDPES